MQLTKKETDKINNNLMVILNDWNDNPQGWILTNNKADKGAGVYFVGTMAEAGRECTKLDALVHTWYVAGIPEKVDKCPKCGKLCHLSILEGLGECLNCDHIASDI